MDTQSDGNEPTLPKLITFKDARAKAKLKKMNNPDSQNENKAKSSLPDKLGSQILRIEKGLNNKRRSSSFNSEDRRENKIYFEISEIGNDKATSLPPNKIVVKRDPRENKWKERLEKSKSTSALLSNNSKLFFI